MDSLESQVVITSGQTAETVAGPSNPTLEWVVLYFPQSGHFYKTLHQQWIDCRCFKGPSRTNQGYSAILPASRTVTQGFPEDDQGLPMRVSYVHSFQCLAFFSVATGS